MMMPSIFGEDLFHDFQRLDGFFVSDIDRKLCTGKRAGHVMSTDIREHEDGYELSVDLPGFKKNEVSAELKDGYLVISAAKGLDKDEKDEKGKYIRRERYAGNMSRSFYVGEGITEQDIHGKFEDGILTLHIPKQDKKQVEEKRYVTIEG